jgi:transglutaminase-like putative cysteine protease
VRYLIEHESRLRFPEPVREHHFELRLAPQGGEALKVLRCEISVSPEAGLREHTDSFGNRVVRGSVMAPHQALDARLVALVETRLENPFAYAPLEAGAERPWLARELAADPSLHSFLLHRSPAVPELASIEGFDAPAYDAARTLFENAVAAMDWCRSRFAFEPGSTPVHAPLATFVKRGGGVCQDFAHSVVAIVRGWGFPARYVAGYVDPGPDAKTEETTHAWAELLVPGAGWRGVDATHGLVVNDLYVPVAVGRDSRDAAPVRGTFKGAAQQEAPEVHLRVSRQGGQQQQ